MVDPGSSPGRGTKHLLTEGNKMELDATLSAILSGFIDNPTAVTELSSACRQYGIRAVRKELKTRLDQETTRIPTPVIVKLLQTTDEGENQYWFYKAVWQYNYNGKKEYSLRELNTNRDLAILYQHQFYRIGKEAIPVGYNYVPYFQGYSIEEWIAAGEFCSDCGTPYIRNYPTEDLCEDCASTQIVHNYSTPVESILGFEPLPTQEQNKVITGLGRKKERLFGVELEYEQVSGRDVYKTLKGHALPKSDGSIRDGVEIVTRPARLVTHKEKLKPFFDKIKTKAYLNTGMHVHVGKDGLSEYRIGFMLEFVNKPQLRKNLIEVAGRDFTTNSYTRPDDKYTMTWGLYEQGYKIFREATDRYTPLNTRKGKTIEFRLFSSPESAEECFAKLDFVNALVDYSDPYIVNVKTLKDKFNWKVFENFIIKNKKTYPDFYNYFIKG